MIFKTAFTFSFLDEKKDVNAVFDGFQSIDRFLEMIKMSISLGQGGEVWL